MSASPPPVPPSRRRMVPRPFGGEVDLYEPVKRFLEGLGYELKGKVRGCDVVAVRRGADGEAEPPIVVELKLAFILGFVLQGVDRLAVANFVYLPCRLDLRANERAARQAMQDKH